MTLSDVTTPGQIGPWSDSNEGVLRIPQSSSITGVSPSDCFLSYQGDSLGGGLTPLQRGSQYTLCASADWAMCFYVCVCTCLCGKMCFFCMLICVYVCVCVCVIMCVHLLVYVYVCVCLCVLLDVGMCFYVCVTSMYLYMYVRVRVYVHVCVFMPVCMSVLVV